MKVIGNLYTIRFLGLRTLIVLLVFCITQYKLIAQPGTNCAQAIQLNIPFNLSSVNSCGFGNNYTGQNGCLPMAAIDPYAGQDVIFTFTPTEKGFLTLQLFNVLGDGQIRPRMYLFQGCPTAGGICVNAMIGNTQTNGTSAVLTVLENVTYYLIVDAAMNNSANAASCFTFNLQSSFVPIPSVPGCTNMTFDSGDFTGWIGTTGRAVTGPPGAPTPDYNITNVGIVNGQHTIMSTGVDPCGGFPCVDPLGTPFSVRLGNSSSGARGEQIMQSFIVTQDNSSLTYRYAVVFQDPNHQSRQQPFFRAIVKDENGDVVPCSDFIVSAASGLPGFFNSPNCNNVKYKPWSTVNVDLSIYAGQNITVEFTTGDCSLGGHYGYAYIDAFCTPSTLNALGDTICIGESIDLNAPNGYAAYRWLPMNDTSQSITVTPTETTIYTLELTAFNGCVSVYDIPVIVTEYPEVSFTYEPDNCDFPVSFTETGVVNVGALYSQWDFGAIADPQTSNLSNPQSLFPGPGTYPVKLIQTTAGGCVDSTIQDITVPNCFFQIRMEGDTICANECFTFEVEKYHGIPPFQYQWSTGATDSTITVCPSETTVYSLTVTDNVGDSYTDSVQVTVSPTVTFDPIVQNITCFGANDGRINPNPIGFGPFTPIWSNDSTMMNLDSLTAGDYTLNLVDNFGCPSAETFTIIEPDTINAEFNLVMPVCNSNSGSIEIINVTGGTPSFRYGIGNGIFVPENLFENLAVGNYNITVRDTNNCQKVFPTLLQNLTDPQAIEFAINNASCGESNGVLQITGIVGGVPPFSYSLDNSPSEPIVTFPVEITNLEGINYTVTITDSNNCFIDSTVSLLQIGAPEAIIAQLDETTCALDNGQITISLVGGIEPIQYSLNNGAFVSNNIFDGLAAGIYQIAIRDSNDCTLEREVEIEPSEGVTVDIEVLSTVVCFGDTTGSLAAEVEGGTAPFDYSWSNGINGDEIYNLSAGEYVVTITDDVGCVATASHVFEIAQPLEVDIIGEDFVCRGLPISLEAVVTGNHSSLSYNWQGLTSALPTITFNSDTSFTVQVIVENEFGCQDTASKFILVRESPQGEIIVDISESCEPACVNYNVVVSSNEPIQNYLWTAENIAPSIENFFKTCYEVSGVYGVTLSMTDIYGCNVVLNGDSLFQFYPVPIADFVSDPKKTNILKPEIHFIQESVNADFSFWNFGDGNFSDEFEPIHIYQDTGKFEICLLITTINNCRDSVCDVIQIDPFPTYYAPNIFTPNKDGLNDVFKLYFTYVVDYRLEIYNRWGELIFISEDPDQGWDGTKNGKLVQSDTYVWKASFVDVLRQPRLIYGRVTLVR